MDQFVRFWRQWWWLAAIIAVKLVIQLLAVGNYGFHRDEYLYLAEAHYPAWGYMEVPPMIAWLGALIRLISDDIFWIKLFPALFGSGILVLIALMTRDLGGNRWAQFLGCLAFLMAPAFLRTNHLFQPVFLNQFMWTLLCYFGIRLVITRNPRIWYGIGIVFGVGMLTKYSMAFLVVAFAAGLLLTDNRKWLRHREPWLAVAIAFVIFLPNLVWQYQHNWPVVAHMETLRSTQLVNVSTSGFLLEQLLMLFNGALVWLPGLIFFFTAKDRGLRMFGWAYVALISILLLGSGKSYYSLGIYPMMLAGGAVWWGGIVQSRKWVRVALPAYLLIFSLGLIPYGLPILPVEQMESYCRWMKDTFGLNAPLVWEDGRERAIPQDYADMFGWEEMVANVAELYYSIPERERQRTNLWGGSYGHAGALLFYAEDYGLPEDVTSFNGSFVLWAKDEADFDRQILVDDWLNLSTEYFAKTELVDSTSHPYARDPGYVIYRTEPVVDIPETWRTLIAENKAMWTRN